MKQDLFELGIFDEPGGELTVIDGTLTWESAISQAETMFKTGKYFGIEIISADSNDMEPIKWSKSKAN